MAQFKAIILKNEHYTLSDNKYNIKIRVSHKGQVRYISTEFNVLETEFDTDTGFVSKEHQNFKYINIKIQSKILDFQKQLIEEGNRINYLNCQQIVNLLKIKPEGELNFYQYAENVINRLYFEKRDNTAYSYQTAIDNLKKFIPDVKFSQMTPRLLKDFEYWMIRQQLKVNTMGIYFRSIRAIYNRAIDDELITIDKYPFRKFKIKREATIKRNLSIGDISLLAGLVLKEPRSKALDIFLLSFYMLGMNMKDLLGTKYDGGERFYYQRSKTKKPFSIKVQPEAKEIWARYDNILEFGNPKDYRWSIKIINKHLKNIAEANSLPKFTTYWARHSWASIAAELEIPKETISLALGHSSNSVTEVYISHNILKVDAANRKIIDAIKKSSNFLEDFTI
jgi:integrase